MPRDDLQDALALVVVDQREIKLLNKCHSALHHVVHNSQAIHTLLRCSATRYLGSSGHFRGGKARNQRSTLKTSKKIMVDLVTKSTTDFPCSADAAGHQRLQEEEILSCCGRWPVHWRREPGGGVGADDEQHDPTDLFVLSPSHLVLGPIQVDL